MLDNPWKFKSDTVFHLISRGILKPCQTSLEPFAKISELIILFMTDIIGMNLSLLNPVTLGAPDIGKRERGGEVGGNFHDNMQTLC